MTFSPFSHSFSLPLRRLLLVGMAGLSLAGPARAISLMDVEAGDILPMVTPLKDDLHLNANQLILWQQTVQRTRALVRQRQGRREQLQSRAAEQLHQPNMEFSDLAAAIAREQQLSEAENNQLRELWLTVADALDDKQREIAQSYIIDRMQRVSVSAGSKGADSGGMGRKGGSGMGGGGMGGGMGGSGMGGMGGSSTGGATEF